MTLDQQLSKARAFFCSHIEADVRLHGLELLATVENVIRQVGHAQFCPVLQSMSSEMNAVTRQLETQKLERLKEELRKELSTEMDALRRQLKQSLMIPDGRNGMSVPDMIDKQLIEWALFQHGGNRKHTAEWLGIGRQTLYNKMDQYGLRAAEPARRDDD